MADTAELQDRFRAAAREHSARAPFHAHLCELIADEPEIAALLAAAPEEQQVPVLLLAAIHDRVLADPGCPLADWYPTVSAQPRHDDVRPALIEHCRAHAAELADVVASRTTQTNEVGRCAMLLPAFGLLNESVGPLAWVDVGASAGLNLHLDRFAYDYRPGGAEGGTVGGAVGGPSTVRLRIETRGRVPVPRAMPEIARRVGLDRAPVDLADPIEVRWLRACVWPDQADRLRRLDAAIDLARAEPVEVRCGDAVDDVAAIVGELASAGHPVVTTSWVLNYLPPSRRAGFVDTLDHLGREHDLSWIFAEAPREATGLPFDPSVAHLPTTVVTLVRWRGGRRHAEHLGIGHPHGYWLHWHDA